MSLASDARGIKAFASGQPCCNLAVATASTFNPFNQSSMIFMNSETVAELSNLMYSDVLPRESPPTRTEPGRESISWTRANWTRGTKFEFGTLQLKCVNVSTWTLDHSRLNICGHWRPKEQLPCNSECPCYLSIVDLVWVAFDSMTDLLLPAGCV